jgi:hypothetical protein
LSAVILSDTGKEGDVDNEMIFDYNNGIRAYQTEEAFKFFFEDTSTGRQEWAITLREVDHWHALRAYQDEQRKKGVPIAGTGGEYWDALPSGPQRGFTFHSLGNIPRIYVYSGLNNPPIGQFTNFRWRPGHGPKGGSNE